MPRLPGDEATRRLLEAHPDTHVIGLTMFDEPDVTRVMLDAGAEECLSKSTQPAELVAAIRRIGAGGSA
jgi:DNA-binding NarL/FixJ family response regulator